MIRSILYWVKDKLDDFLDDYLHLFLIGFYNVFNPQESVTHIVIHV
jgi:hypothetical protein